MGTGTSIAGSFLDVCARAPPPPPISLGLLLISSILFILNYLDEQQFDHFYYYTYRSRMKRLLEEGTTLIVDRYAFSGVAFTAAKHVSYKNTVQLTPTEHTNTNQKMNKILTK